MDEMGEKHHPLLRLRGGDDLSLDWKSMSDVLGQVPGLSELLDVLLLDGGGHPLASRSRHVRNVFAEKVKAWALELENGRAEEEEGMGEKGNPYHFIKAAVMCLPTWP